MSLSSLHVLSHLISVPPVMRKPRGEKTVCYEDSIYISEVSLGFLLLLFISHITLIFILIYFRCTKGNE